MIFFVFQESQNFSYELKKTSDLLKSPGFDSSSKVLDTETGKNMKIHSMFEYIQYLSVLFQISEIMRNREFYRLNDVRPPYTYASLIRQVSDIT